MSGFNRDMLVRGPTDTLGPISIKGEYSHRGVWVVFLGGDFEAFVDSQGRTLAFRRRDTAVRLKGAPIYSSLDWSLDDLPPAEFKTALVSHLALAVRRCLISKDVIARSSALMDIITKAMGELEKLQDKNASQRELREEIGTIRLRMFTRLMSADLRKGPIPER